MNRESYLVERIARALQSKNVARRAPGSLSTRSFGLGITLDLGDDAAAFHLPASSDCVVSCDAFVEGIHFLTKTHPADSVGYKSLARATSDLAAMGTSPRYFLLTLALPAANTGPWLDEFLAGMARASRDFRIRCIGGDTTRNSQISIAITVIGESPRGRAIPRRGARPGDLIYVSGTLGRASLGLTLTLAGHSRRASVRALVAPHLHPQARVALGAWLAQHKIPTAMIDLSDGLSTDLARICTASRVGAIVDLAKLPRLDIPDSAVRLLRGKKPKLDPLAFALHGGDDYELLFTVPPRLAAKLRRAPGHKTLRQIGEITRTRKILTRDSEGHLAALAPRGWDSFRWRASTPQRGRR
jgi:thiamine-monophosphate kinase